LPEYCQRRTRVLDGLPAFALAQADLAEVPQPPGYTALVADAAVEVQGFPVAARGPGQLSVLEADVTEPGQCLGLAELIIMIAEHCQGLEPILDLFTPHGRTTTSIVHSAPVPPRSLPVQAPQIGHSSR
jgi:hypothetical protein